jgi:hypothetical protein
VTTYRVTLSDRESQTIVGYYICPRNADVIKVEEVAAED